jgi:hypothetical protein
VQRLGSCGVFFIRAIRAEEVVAPDAAHAVQASLAAGVARLSGFPKAVAHVRREAQHVFVFRAVISVNLKKQRSKPR